MGTDLSGEDLQTRRATLLTFYRRAFADHKLVEGLAGYTCRRKDGGNSYWFSVIVLPGAVFVYGDIGELVLRVSTNTADETLAWLKSSVPSSGGLDYVLGKCRQPEQDFIVGELWRWFRAEGAAQFQDDPEKLDELHQGATAVDEHELGRKWPDLWYEVTGGAYDEPPACRDWGSQMLIQFAALEWFIAHLNN